jgi:hypothetical protein
MVGYPASEAGTVLVIAKLEEQLIRQRFRGIFFL